MTRRMFSHVGRDNHLPGCPHMVKILNTDIGREHWYPVNLHRSALPPSGTHSIPYTTFNSMVPTLRHNHRTNTPNPQPSVPKPRLKCRKSLPKKQRPAPSKGNRARYSYTEETLQRALREIKNGVLDRKGALKKYGIPYTTIIGRLKGRQQRSAAHAPQQVLSPLQEEVLCSWIEFYSAQGRPIGVSQIRLIAQDIAGSKKPPNRSWVRCFLQRHKELAVGKPSGLDPKRAQSFNKEAVREHFKELKEKLEMLGFPIENIYNMDEKGCQRGGGRRAQLRKYFMSATRRAQYQIRSDNLELITIIECVCADGSNLQPGFIFPGVNPFREWFQDGIDNDILYVPYDWTHKHTLTWHFSVGTTENGWTTDQACLKWFNHCFLPQAQARNKTGKPIALLMDGHGSHVTKALRTLAEANNVHIYTFPSHTTHKLQPLDVGVFGPLQRAWQGRCVEVLQEQDSEVTQRKFVHEYLAVRNKVFTPSLIQKAFKNTGIHPLNPDIFTSKDFAPSQVSSHKVHVPLSYPEPHLQDENNDGDHGNEWGSDWDSSDEEGDEMEDLVGNDNTQSLGSNGNTGDGDESDGSSEGSEEEDSSNAVVDEPPTKSSTCDNENPQHPKLSTGTSNDAPADQGSHTNHVPNLAPRPCASSSMIPASMEGLQAQVRKLEAENEALHTHATMAYREINHLQHRVNAKKSKKGKGRVSIATTEVRWWTVGEGRRLALEKDAEDEAKAKKKEQAVAERHTKTDARQKQRATLTTPFSGAISSKTKEDLKDITFALPLAIDSKATKADLALLINQHLDNNPHLAEHPRFSGLYASRSRAKRSARPSNRENTMPPPVDTQNPVGSNSNSKPAMQPPTSAVPRSPTGSPLSFERTMIPPDTAHLPMFPPISLEEKTRLLFNAPISANIFYGHTHTYNPLYIATQSTAHQE